MPEIKGQTIAVDTETCDQSLTANKGPGWVYGAGYIAGVSAAWPGEGGGFNSIYAPIRHPDSECFSKEQVANWVQYLYDNNTVVFQSATYDIGWTTADLGVRPPAKMHDTILAAVIIDENELSYNLDAICKKLGIPGKDERLLRETAAVFNVDPKKGLWRLPARFVGPYAGQDAVATLHSFTIMYQQVIDQGLLAPYTMDCALIPMVVEMRRRGIRLDCDRAERMAVSYERRRDEILAEMTRRLPIGKRITIDDVQSPKFLERMFTMERVPFPRTAKTKQGSFQSEWMRDHDHWLPKMVVAVDQLQMMSSKFLRGFLLEFAHKGRLHAEIHSHRSDEGGTRSYRFSYSDPPLQQIPSRSEDGRLIRTCFLPEDGELWCSTDYSQQEFRLIVHYSVLLGQKRAQEAADLYRSDPNTDFHKLVADWTGLPRRRAKDTNFAKAFGAGVPKFAQMIHKSKEEAKTIYDQYDRELPFVSGSAKKCSNLAQQRGYIKLIDGAKCRFDLWEPAWRDAGEAWSPATSLEMARSKYGVDRKLKRAFTHKAFNRLIQGSAARQTRKAMLEMWRAGIVPLLQMHDDIPTSVSSDRTVDQITEIMVNVIKLEVPVVAEPKIGTNWGDLEERRKGAVSRYHSRVASGRRVKQVV